MRALRVCPVSIPVPCPTARCLRCMWLHRQLLWSIRAIPHPFPAQERLPGCPFSFHRDLNYAIMSPSMGQCKQLVQFTQ